MELASGICARMERNLDNTEKIESSEEAFPVCVTFPCPDLPSLWNTERILDRLADLGAVLLENFFHAVNGSSMISEGFKHFLRSILACLKRAIETEITTPQKLLHVRPPSACRTICLCRG